MEGGGTKGLNSHVPKGSIPTGMRAPPSTDGQIFQDGDGAFRGGGGAQLRAITCQNQSNGDRGILNTEARRAQAELGLKFASQVKFVDGIGDKIRAEGADGGEDVVDEEAKLDRSGAELFMGLYYHGGRLGIAVYDESDTTLSMCQIADGGPNMEGLTNVLYQIRPTLVVTNAKPDKVFEDVLLKPGEGIEYNVAFSPSRNFQYVPSRALLFQLELDIYQGVKSEANKRHRISSEVDLEAKEAVSAAGGLLQHLQSNKLVDDLSDSMVISVTRIKALRLEKFLSIDPQTMASLSIFQQDAHPSLSGCGPAKEGLSLFSLLNNTKSPLGKSLLRMWFMRPLLDEVEIYERLKAVRFFTRPDCLDLVGTLRDILRGVKDVPRILLRIRKASASVNDWSNLRGSLESLFHLKEVCSQFHHDACPGEAAPSIFHKVKDEIISHLHNLEVMLSQMINFEESAQFKRISIQSGICADLDEHKRQYEGLGDFLHSVAQEESSELPPSADVEFYVLFCPQLGYMVASPNDVSKRFLETAPGFDINFMTNEWIYWKTPRMHELDETVGDIFAAICDREFQLTDMIRNKMLEFHLAILDACGLAAELDCVLGFAVAAVERDFCEPALVQEAVLYIEKGRHPLCELCTETFVPNNTALDSQSPGSAGLSIVTGANFSGKSVYMKQTALIAFMVHIGSFVPAANCQVGLIDRIFSRVQSRESCSMSSSSFAIDLNQVALMLRASTSRSLLLIDEFGKGTQPEDGVSLLAASIRELLARGRECPRTIVVTNHSELFTVSGILPSSSAASIAYCTMSVMLQEDENHPGGENAAGSEARVGRDDCDEAEKGIVFLYRLVEGRSSQSHGYECALNAGVPHNVVERARQVSAKLRNHQPIERLQSEDEVRAAGHLEAAVAMLQKFDVERGDLRAFMAKLASIAGTLENKVSGKKKREQ